MLLGAILTDGCYLRNALCATSSHFSTAERQYRFPLEQGTTRPAQSQWTVTGAGGNLISLSGDGVKIISAFLFIYKPHLWRDHFIFVKSHMHLTAYQLNNPECRVRIIWKSFSNSLLYDLTIKVFTSQRPRVDHIAREIFYCITHLF
jgi:hypothetical protein